ncbi:TlpA family protein disulfide reductase [Polaribacter sp. IC073]|uniref:TlpA family protein disulfide reductase n=1 Tax=Polaribacter sp. IC073 TaxID=2508540 RepID=UPI0011BE6960|nr:TlpA disulfide reductase family protein [Polaribacter sp. IC073]TXD45967.1 TlpA family protein disulfide reductase [Polaribacter sp. IC073]
MKKIFLVFILACVSCNLEKPTEFSELALNDTIYSADGTSFSIKNVLNNYKGKKVLIDFWASWCGDCIKGLPNVRKLQKEYPAVVFLFLSVDKSKYAWRRGINRFQIEGEHYNLPRGMKNGDFVDFVNLGWIPRYMVIDEQGKITLFKATSASDSSIEEALKTVI